MKIKEIMKKYIVSVKPNDNAMGALGLLFKMQISGLPVIDEQGKLIGMFTEKDVLSYVLPGGSADKVGGSIYEEGLKSAKKKFREAAKIKVGQLMRRDVVTTTEEAALFEVARLMLAQKARRLPVLDKSGRIVGIVARYDVLSALAHESGVTINNKDK